MTSHAQEMGDRTRRQAARDQATSMLDALQDAKLTYGPAVSLNKIAYHVTGKGILTQRDKRWSGQTISDVIKIADIQNASITAAWLRIQGTYGPGKAKLDPDLVKWWRETLTEEVLDVEKLGRAIAERLSRPPSEQPRPRFDQRQ